MTNRISHTKFKKKLLENKSVAAEYKDLEEEYQLLREMIKARKKAGLTQENVADSMNTTKSAISRLESFSNKNQSSPSFSTLKRYAHAVGCKLQIKIIPTSRK